MRIRDATALPHVGYWYRLVGESATAVQSVLALVHVLALDAARTGLVGVRPLASGALEVRFAVGPAPAGVDVALYDVRGRRVLPGFQETLEPGSYLRVLPARNADPALPRGVYFLCFRAGEIRTAQKVALLGF